MIKAAAIKFIMPEGPDLICTMAKPSRHADILHALNSQFMSGRKASSIIDEVEGFLDDKGFFLDRAEAYKHAKRFGPPLVKREPGDYQGPELFSEDLW